MILKAIGVDKGSGKPNTVKVGTITKAQVKVIAEKKMVDMNANDINAAMKMVEGAARSMGVEVK
jgi:large subunit ribosomal protein L11